MGKRSKGQERWGRGEKNRLIRVELEQKGRNMRLLVWLRFGGKWSARLLKGSI